MLEDRSEGYRSFLIELRRLLNRRLDSALQDWADEGTIYSDGSLRVSRFASQAWQRGEYYVWQPFFLPDPMTTTGPASAGTAHTHAVPRPVELAPPTPTTTVLVVFINDGVDPVVLGKLIRS